jgi:hypothetical protein
MNRRLYLVLAVCFGLSGSLTWSARAAPPLKPGTSTTVSDGVEGKYAVWASVMIKEGGPGICMEVEQEAYWTYSGVGCLRCDTGEHTIQWEGLNSGMGPSQVLPLLVKKFCGLGFDAAREQAKEAEQKAEKELYGLRYETHCDWWNRSMAQARTGQCTYWAKRTSEGKFRMTRLVSEGSSWSCVGESNRLTCTDGSDTVPSHNGWCLDLLTDGVCPRVYGGHVP